MVSGHKTNLREVLEDLKRSARALGFYRGYFVLVGGLVPLCYRALYQNNLEQRALLTFDIDWAVPNSVPIKSGQTVIEAMNSAGYQEVLSHLMIPPVAKFQHKRFGTRNAAPVYLDFITDRLGGSSSRSGKDNTRVDVQSGFKVIALPYVRILLENTVTVDLSRLEQLGIKKKLNVRLPHPANYILHKLLVSAKRGQKEKANKDLAYVYDVAMVLQNEWETISRRLNQYKEKATFPANWLKTAKKIANKNFKDSTSEGPIAVARIYQSVSEPTTAEGVFRVLNTFFRSVGLST